MKSLTIFFLVLCSALTYAQPDIRWYTEDYPPISFKYNGQTYGVAYDILKEAYAQLGWQLNAQNITVAPWPRVYKSIIDNSRACAFTVAYTKKRALLFNYAGLVLPNTIALIAHKDSDISKAQIKSNHDLKFGVVKNDIGHQMLLEYGIPEERFVYLKTGLELVRMIDYKRVDLIAYGDEITRFHFQQAQIDPSNYIVIMPLYDSKLGYACNKKVSTEHLKQLDITIKKVIENDPSLLNYSFLN
jgi:ABC-type amino acid transport substrate-binding protein